MTTGFDELQNQIMAEMGQIYTETVIDHAMNPRNAGSIPGADGFATVTGPCGDTMEIRLKVKDNKVADATFWTDDCGTSIACGSMATEMIKGRNVAEVLAIDQSNILKVLGGLPENSIHCALLASSAIQAAIRDYLAVKRDPWKKAYRR